MIINIIIKILFSPPPNCAALLFSENIMYIQVTHKLLANGQFYGFSEFLSVIDFSSTQLCGLAVSPSGKSSGCF